jgi:hypothetical protein
MDRILQVARELSAGKSKSPKRAGGPELVLREIHVPDELL